MDFDIYLKAQRNFIKTGETRSVGFRKSMLKKLYDGVKLHQNALTEALEKDLGKSSFESYVTEIGLVLSEIRLQMKNVGKWSRTRRVKTPLYLPGSRSKVMAEPYGVCLLMAPWNYPVNLLLMPLAGAIAAGNTVFVKPSEISVHTEKALAALIEDVFPSHFVKVVTGGKETNQALLAKKWDYIFFTGGETLGRIVAESAARQMTPCTLELGGKSPCIVDKNISLSKTAQRIVWGKFLNAGQTCVAPDYLLVHEDVKEALIEEMKNMIKYFFGDDPFVSPDYPRIISDVHYMRLTSFLSGAKILAGGQTARDKRYIAPTLVDIEGLNSPLMKEEIFGPVLPVITFSHIPEVINLVLENPTPLSLYLFTSDSRTEKMVMEKIPFGGGCINNTLIHQSNPYLPFGGVGSSGIGSYHGLRSFQTFSHYKGLIKTPFSFSTEFQYPPYSSKKQRLINLFLR